MWRHSCEPEASARVMEAWPLRFKGQAAELDSTSGGAISRARDEPQAIPAHLGRSLKSLFWVRAWRNKSHLCWVYASVSPAHSGPQRLKTDAPSRLLSGSRHTRLSQPPGRSAGAQNWRLCPLGGFLPDSLRFHRISKTYNMTSSVQVPPPPPQTSRGTARLSHAPRCGGKDGASGRSIHLPTPRGKGDAKRILPLCIPRRHSSSISTV